jgi:PadR family transcriptional regulator, regulatory protein PadR
VQTSSSLMSGVSELLLLNLLAEREMYGYELARAIRVTTKEAISVGESVLYPALHTLERRGWLRARRRLVGGRTRVYYSLTPAGKRRLGAMNQEWRRIAGGVQAALGASHG